MYVYDSFLFFFNSKNPPQGLQFFCYFWNVRYVSCRFVFSFFFPPLSPFTGWVRVFSASLEILLAWHAFQPGLNILTFFVYGSFCDREPMYGEHEMRMKALHSTFPLHFPVLAKSLLARASWQGPWICQVFQRQQQWPSFPRFFPCARCKGKQCKAPSFQVWDQDCSHIP